MSFEQNTPEYEPWDSGVYRTGSTKPPKNHAGLIVILLVSVILLCGIVTVLSFLNIRLYKQIDQTALHESLPIVISANTEAISEIHDVPEYTDTPEETKEPIHSETSPLSVANIPQEGGLSLQEIYERVIPSVVSISCKNYNGSSTGTGVILSESGYIVTNCHVVENADFIEVLLTDGRIIEAELVGMDSVSDLAVLYISAGNLVAARMGDSSVLRVGDMVVAIGDPLGIELRGTMTDGIVSAINRDIEVDGRTMSLIQTNAALNSGNSGGPLINCYGQVVGINTMKMGDNMGSGGVEGLGFAIPSSTVEEIVNQLIEQGYVSGRPDLGITGEAVSTFYQLYYRLPQGLYITEVAEGSAAATAGISPGDILISIEGTPITSSSVLKSVLYAYAPGDQIHAIVYHSGRQYNVTLFVGEAKN